tara:strand:+ start:1213 stop:1422 length:210 start_codon:yes stop_codon:yes gene_type:complete
LSNLNYFTIKNKKRTILKEIKKKPSLYNDLNVINRGIVQYYLKTATKHKRIDMIADILFGFHKGVKEND